MAQTADASIDTTGATCPLPLLGAKKALDALRAGQTLRLISDCSGTRDDVQAWCRQAGHVLVSIVQGEGKRAAYLLRKADNDEARPAPHVALDMRGVPCPGPVLEAQRQLRGMRGGEILQLLTDCTAADDDIPAWSRGAAIDLLYQRQTPGGVSEFYLRKN